MGHNHLMVLCGRLGFVAAFVLITAIIAAPLLQRVWSPEVAIVQRQARSMPEHGGPQRHHHKRILRKASWCFTQACP